MSAFQPGDVISGRYRLMRVMGAGAMGVVWSARNESTERDFAIKLMLPEAAKDPQRLSRFFKEAKLAGRLRHRCIVEVYDLGRIESGPHAGAPYLVMELLDGEPLDALLRRTGKLPAGTALRILGEVARGLEVAHAQGIVHRDLKPANVFLHRTLDGFTTPKILDFGISKLMSKTERSKEWAQETTIGTILGSPAYMSPEQTAAEDLDPRADVWSLGVVLYRALSGEFPFVAANFTTLMLAINTQDPKPLEERVPGLPRELYALVGKCLSRRRSDRYASAGALADAIDRVMEQHELPVLELSQVVGEAAPLPSEHMKTQSFQAGSTLPFGVTTPTRTKKVTEGTTTVTESTREVVENEPQIVDNISPIDAMASAPVPVAVLGTSTSKEPRRRAPFAIAALVALLAIGFFGLRARTSTDAPVAASAPPPAAKPIETMAAPVAPSVSVTSVGTSVGAAAPPSASVKSDVPKVGAPIKKTPPAIKSKPPQGPHEGLVRPGF